MRTTIDDSGRILVPRQLRERLGLASGTRVEIRGRDGRLEVEPVPEPIRLVRRGKSFVAVAGRPLPTLSAEEVRTVLEGLRRRG